MLIIEAVSMPTIAVVHISVHVRPAFPCVVLYSCRHTEQVAAVKLIACTQESITNTRLADMAVS